MTEQSLPQDAVSIDPQALRKLVEDGKRNEAYRLYRLACDLNGEAAVDPKVHYWGLMALARSGFILEAIKRYRDCRLSDVDTQDFRLLPARLLKDLYFQTGRRHGWMVRHARDIYRREYDREQDGFPGINAAFLSFVADDQVSVGVLAGEIISSLRRTLKTDDLEARDVPVGEAYAILTLVEALYLAGREDEATTILSRLMRNPSVPQGAIDNFLKQLSRIRAHEGRALPDLPQRNHPTLMRYCGEIFCIAGDVAQPFEAAHRPVVGEVDLIAARETIVDVLQTRNCETVVGALAAGADLLVAETALDLGLSLHVVLPSGVDDFRSRSVTPFGSHWEHAFERCLGDKNTNLMMLSGVLSDGPDLGTIYAGASDVTMGVAQLLAEAETLTPSQVSIYTNHSDPGSLTRRDAELWRSRGLDQVDITVKAEAGGAEASPALADGRGQLFVSTIFCDLVGCSRMSEDETARIFEELYEEIGRELKDFDSILERNTWGDAVFLVMTDIAEAVEAALALRRFADERLHQTMGEGTTFRIACHHGPAYKIYDRIRELQAYTGLSVVKTARIEPVTPPGEVYATQSFAGKIKFDGLEGYTLELVGEVPLAKKFGSEIVYSLRRADFDLSARELEFVRSVFGDAALEHIG